MPARCGKFATPGRVRDQISREQALAILQSQATRHQRLALADNVIDNQGSLTELDQAMAALHAGYGRLAIAGKRRLRPGVDQLYGQGAEIPGVAGCKPAPVGFGDGSDHAVRCG